MKWEQQWPSKMTCIYCSSEKNNLYFISFSFFSLFNGERREEKRKYRLLPIIIDLEIEIRSWGEERWEVKRDGITDQEWPFSPLFFILEGWGRRGKRRGGGEEGERLKGISRSRRALSLLSFILAGWGGRGKKWGLRGYQEVRGEGDRC